MVVGGGAAGLMAALELPKALKVLLLCRDSELRSASRWAQGGLAAAVGHDDSPDLHRADTLEAGAGCRLVAACLATTLVVDGIFLGLALLIPKFSGLV